MVAALDAVGWSLVIGAIGTQAVLIIKTFRDGRVTKDTHTLSKHINEGVNGVGPNEQSIRQNVQQLVRGMDKVAATQAEQTKGPGNGQGAEA